MEQEKLTNEDLLEVVANAVNELAAEENFNRIKNIAVTSKSEGKKQMSVNIKVLLDTVDEIDENESYTVKTGDLLDELVQDGQD